MRLTRKSAAPVVKEPKGGGGGGFSNCVSYYTRTHAPGSRACDLQPAVHATAVVFSLEEGVLRACVRYARFRRPSPVHESVGALPF